MGVRRSGSALDRDPEFDRLSRLSRSEMTEAEYQSFRSKLAQAQSTFLVDLRPDARKDKDDEARRDSVPQRDILLQPGDLVIAERKSFVVRVAGEVVKPGLIEVAPGRKWEEYVELAGGYAARANHSGVRVTRSSTGQTTLVRSGDLRGLYGDPDEPVPGAGARAQARTPSSSQGRGVASQERKSETGIGRAMA